MLINLVAPINKLGYGIASVNILYELSKLADVALFPIYNTRDISADSKYNECIKTGLSNVASYDTNAPCIRIWHQHEMTLFAGKKKIGFPFFELDRFTNLERHQLSCCDHLFVPSKWAQSILETNNIQVSSSVIPLGVDQSIFYLKKSNINKTIFLNIGKWEIRKGHDILPKIMAAALGGKDNWELWMLPHNPFFSDSDVDSFKKLYAPISNNVRFLPRVETSKDVANIINMSDCGIFPSRAEGWNLEALEMLSCGKHIIISNYSGHTEYCTPDNSMLLDVKSTEPAHDGVWFKGQGSWAKIDDDFIEQGVEYVRKIHNLKQSRLLPVNVNGIGTAADFCWEKTASKILRNI